MYQKKLLADGQLSVKDIKEEGLRLFQITHTYETNPKKLAYKTNPKISPKVDSTTQNTTKKNYQETTKNLREKIYKIIKSSPDIKIQKIADICGITYDGVRYHTTALKKAGFIQREGGDNGGSWKILK